MSKSLSLSCARYICMFTSDWFVSPPRLPFEMQTCKFYHEGISEAKDEKNSHMKTNLRKWGWVVEVELVLLSCASLFQTLLLFFIISLASILMRKSCVTEYALWITGHTLLVWASFQNWNEVKKSCYYNVILFFCRHMQMYWKLIWTI